ncbi:MAG TPA: hypothetical protein VMB25_09380 [Bryobacteraceae bacterium]|nr:hypothetical protein [Bryobacteraceae bacterium]
MRHLFFLILLVQALAAAPQDVMVVKGSDVAGIDKALTPKLDDHKAAAEPFRAAGDYQAIVVHREGDSDAELDEKDAELLVVESGEATLVTGGKLVGPKAPVAGNVHAASLDGGAKTALAEKDVVLIPANLPYQILLAAGKQVSYLLIRHKGPDESFEVESSSAAPNAATTNGNKALLGADMGLGFRACVAGDKSPDGTIVDGYKKVISRNFTAHSCLWVPLHQTETVPKTANGSAAGNPGKPQLGIDMGGGYRACVPGDKSPEGTEVDGYRKLYRQAPVGISCGWVKIQ